MSSNDNVSKDVETVVTTTSTTAVSASATSAAAATTTTTTTTTTGTSVPLIDSDDMEEEDIELQGNNTNSSSGDSVVNDNNNNNNNTESSSTTTTTTTIASAVTEITSEELNKNDIVTATTTATATPSTSTSTTSVNTTNDTILKYFEEEVEEDNTNTAGDIPTPSVQVQQIPSNTVVVDSNVNAISTTATAIANTNTNNNNNNNEVVVDVVDDDDITSKAAVALAAVAAAANAKHSKSPAEAAREARDLAHTFITQATNTTTATSVSSSLLLDNNNNSSSSSASASHNNNNYNTDQVNGSITNTGINNNNNNNNTTTTSNTTSNIRSSSQQKLITVPLHGVKSHLRKRSSNSTMTIATATTTATTSSNNHTTTTADKLLHNENDPFLQHLLLLEHYRCTTTTTTSDTPTATIAVVPALIVPATATNIDATTTAATTVIATTDPTISTTPNTTSSDTNHDLITSQQACERLEAVYRRIENAYDSLVDRLPQKSSSSSSHNNRNINTVKQQQQPKPSDVVDDTGNSSLNSSSDNVDDDVDDDDDEDNGFDAAIVVPDLLPSCISEKGDLTISFFRACMGEVTTTTSTTNTQQQQQRSSTMMGQSSISNNGGDSSQQQQQPLSTSGDGNNSKNVHATSSITTTANHPSSTSDPPLSPGKTASVFSSLFKRQATAATNSTKVAAFNVFRKSKQNVNDGKSDMTSMNSLDTSTTGSMSDVRLRPGEYVVKIEREMLGLTVENVLERTVVRTVVPNGPAKKAGAKVGSLIVKVGNVETKNLTHFETIDELRQSNRPLQLVMRQISDSALQSAREEMGRLIKGYGFGTIIDNGNRPRADSSQSGEDGEPQQHTSRPLIEADLRTFSYTNLIRRRCAEVTPVFRSKKDEALAKASEKLIWILTLLIVGLEREANYLFSLVDENARSSSGNEGISNTDSPPSLRRIRNTSHHHTAKDYMDAAKSISKVLYDFTRKKMDAETFLTGQVDGKGGATQLPSLLGKTNRGPPRRHIIAQGKFANNELTVAHETPLLQIGDVLQRTRTFLADPTSPPAALLRGEVISFLCDILDLDTEMELSEEEAVSSTTGPGAGAGAGVMNDLGSAGSLLKLIVLNCPIMRSPCCDEVSRRHDSAGSFDDQDSRKRLEPARKFSSSDLHRQHAGNRFLAVVHRLAASRSTSSRITACSLAPVLWGHLDFPYQLQLRGVITRALHDVEVIVRKSTATVLHEIAELVFDVRSVPWLVLMCERAMTDPEPQLRSAAMTLTWHLAEHLPNAFLGDARQGSRYLRRLPKRDDPLFADVYLLQCKLLPVATRLAEDRSPSVRLAVAAQCDRLCDALGYHWSSVIIDVLLGLLSDSDERVRCEAVSCVPRLSEIVLQSSSSNASASSEVSILEGLLPASTKLQKDVCVSVRVALATAAGELLTLLVAMARNKSETALQPGTDEQTHDEWKNDQDAGKKYKMQVDDRLIPVVQALLNDVDPEVTSAALRAVSNATRSSVLLSRPRHMSVASFDDDASFASSHSHGRRVDEPVFLPVLSENQVLRLLPILTELADSRQWRVRQSAVEIVPALLGCTTSLTTRSEISKLCIRLMADQVDAVRKTAAECLCMGGSSLGSHGEDAGGEWISSIVFPTINRCAIDPQSKQRLLCLKMVEVILLNGVCPGKWYGSVNSDRASSPIRELVAITLSLTSDRIANVRLNVGRTLELVMHLLDEHETNLVRDGMKSQIEFEMERGDGADVDVLFFANRCLRQAESMINQNTQEQL